MLNIKRIIYFLIPIIVFVLVYSIVNPEYYNSSSDRNNSHGINRSSLFEDLYHNGGLIIYAASEPAYVKQYLTAADNIQKEFRWARLTIIPDTAVTQIELKNNSIIIIGTYKSNKVLRKLSGLLPVKFSNSGFTFHQQTFNNQSTTLNLFYYNPFNKKKLCYVISGVNDKYVSNLSNVRAVGDIRLMQNGLCTEMGFFKPDSGGIWVLDEKSFRNFIDERKVYNISKNFNYTVYSKDITYSQIKNIDKANEASLQKLKLFFGKKFIIPKINFYVFDNFEDKGLITGNTQLSNIRDSSIDFVVNNWISGNDFSRAASFLIKKNFGDPKLDFLQQGLSVYFSNDWRGKG